MNNVSFEGWMPIGVSTGLGLPQVDWCRFGGMRFSEPFFEQTVARALRDPARLLFRRRTPLAVLESREIQEGVRPPRGFIFHVSRCGSTLLAQMLAALPQSHVVSEAPPLDELLGLLRGAENVAPEQRVAWLRGMVLALGMRDDDCAHDYFIKFDSWHVLEMPAILQAFPDVPWVFLYRDPVEVMVSQCRQRGIQMVPGMMDPRFFNIEPSAAFSMGLDEYCARSLACNYMAGLAHSQKGRGRLVNFSELPDVLWDTLGGLFGLEWSPEDMDRMRCTSQLSAKAPGLPHSDDSESKRREATPEVRRLVAEWLAEPYARLEERRLNQSGVSARLELAGAGSGGFLNQMDETQNIAK